MGLAACGLWLRWTRRPPHQETGVGETLLHCSGPALWQWPCTHKHSSYLAAPPHPRALTLHWKQVMVLSASHGGLSLGPPASQISPCPRLCTKSLFQPLGPSELCFILAGALTES